MLCSYLIAYLAQLNPLFGPIIKNGIVGHMRQVWTPYGADSNAEHVCKLKVYIHVLNVLHDFFASHLAGYPSW